MPAKESPSFRSSERSRVPASLASLPRRETAIGSLTIGRMLWIRPQTRLETVRDLLVERDLDAVPVVDDDGRPAGLITKTDVFHPRWRPDAEDARRFSRHDEDGFAIEFLDDVRTDSPVLVDDVTVHAALCLPEDTSASQAAAAMVFENAQHVLIVDGDGYLAGFVSALDLMAQWPGLGESTSFSEYSSNLAVRRIMHPDVIAVGRRQSAKQVLDLMQNSRVHHLPVVDGTELVGVVSERDFRFLSGPDLNQRTWLAMLAAEDLMTSPPHTLPPHALVREAQDLLRKPHVGCVPIVEHRQLIGIVTRTDLLRALLLDVGDAGEDRDTAHH